MKLTKIIIGLVVMAVAGSAMAASKDCKVIITAGDSTKFSSEEIVIPQKTCPSFTLKFKHQGKLPLEAMGHNVVITKTSDFDAVVADGLKAGEENDYVKPDDKRVVALTKLLGGGQEDTIEIDTSRFTANDDYTFFCSFPGHPATMKGKVKVLDK